MKKINKTYRLDPITITLIEDIAVANAVAQADIIKDAVAQYAVAPTLNAIADIDPLVVKKANEKAKKFLQEKKPTPIPEEKFPLKGDKTLIAPKEKIKEMLEEKFSIQRGDEVIPEGKKLEKIIVRMDKFDFAREYTQKRNVILPPQAIENAYEHYKKTGVI